MMKFGINTFLFASPFTVGSTRWFRQFKILGFDGGKIAVENPAESIRRAGKHVGPIHASASDCGTPGNDSVDWPGMAKALKALRYQGAVVIKSLTQDVKVMARAAAIWRTIEPCQDDNAIQGLAFLKKSLK